MAASAAAEHDALFENSETKLIADEEDEEGRRRRRRRGGLLNAAKKAVSKAAPAVAKAAAPIAPAVAEAASPAVEAAAEAVEEAAEAACADETYEGCSCGCLDHSPWVDNPSGGPKTLLRADWGRT